MAVHPWAYIGIFINCHTHIYHQVAAFFPRSLGICTSGVMPSTGAYGPFESGSHRSRVAGKALPLRCCYFNTKFDQKERVQSNQFCQWWQCTKICDSCLAEKPSKYGDPCMDYRDFHPYAPYKFTTITKKMYERFYQMSPYGVIPGWNLHLSYFSHSFLPSSFLVLRLFMFSRV